MSIPKVQILSRDDIESIHNALLKVLESTGIKVMSEKALDILREAGAKVDYGKHHAIIPQNLGEEALSKTPRIVKYCVRNPKYDFVLDKKEIHFTTGGPPPCIMDWKTGEYSPGAPERGIIHMALARLVDYYKLPRELCSGNSNCKVPDIQAGFERAINLTAAMLMGGVDIIDGVGAIDASNAMSPELQ